MKLLIAAMLMLCSFTFAQPFNQKNSQGGIISVGGRTTLSSFNHGEFGNTGMGLGGQFRLQFADRVNSDWFFDYITGDIEDFAHRTDYHIGWSVIYYPMKNLTPKVRPYVLGGHCFDYTRLVDNANSTNFVERWMFIVAGFAMVYPGAIADLVGFGLVLLALTMQFIRFKNNRSLI